VKAIQCKILTPHNSNIINKWLSEVVQEVVGR